MRMRSGGRTYRSVVPVVVFVAVLAVACGGGSSDGDAKAVDRDGTLRFAILFGSLGTLDPHKSFTATNEPWLKPLYDRLVKVANGRDGQLELVPELAKSFEVAPDGLSIGFELRDDVTFQDGNRFNAAAVKANVERAKGPDSLVASNLASIRSVEVVDDTHVVMRLAEPDPSVLWNLAQSHIGSMISPAALNNPDLGTKPVGSGPFTLASYQQNGETVYERWDGYWQKDAAMVQRVVLSVVPDPNARFNGVRSGSFDAAYVSPPQDLEAMETDGGFHAQLAYSTSALGVLLNNNKPPFDDVRVRRAVWMAINRTEISNGLLGGVGPPLYQPFLETMFGHDPSLDNDSYDPAAARKLIREAGAEGITVNMMQQADPPLNTMAEVVQEALTDIGLKVQLTPIATAQAFSEWAKGGYQAWAGAIGLSPDPSRYVNSYLGVIDKAVQPGPELMDLVTTARGLPLGSEEQEKAWFSVSRYLVENPVHVPIVQVRSIIFSTPNVVGWENLQVDHIIRVDFRNVGIAKSA